LGVALSEAETLALSVGAGSLDLGLNSEIVAMTAPMTNQVVNVFFFTPLG
jgi:hypothetical protein